MFQLTGGALPAAGAVWSMRDYVGAITSGNGYASNDGPYDYFNPTTIQRHWGELRWAMWSTRSTATNRDLGSHTVPDP
jgi:hypothetical protein